MFELDGLKEKGVEVKEDEEYVFMKQTPHQFLERRIATLFGVNSLAMSAFDLVREEMSAERGFARDNGDDYSVHCSNVANTLISFCVKDEDVICAALLHDIVEDVPGFTEGKIEKLFNARVARLVMLVTKDPNKNYKDPKVMQAYIDAISEDMYASAIKTADRMHNMETLQRKSLEKRHAKALETEKFYLPLFKKCRYRYPRFENLFYAARTQIRPLLDETKACYREVEQLKERIEELEGKKNT